MARLDCIQADIRKRSGRKPGSTIVLCAFRKPFEIHYEFAPVFGDAGNKLWNTAFRNLLKRALLSLQVLQSCRQNVRFANGDNGSRDIHNLTVKFLETRFVV